MNRTILAALIMGTMSTAAFAAEPAPSSSPPAAPAKASGPVRMSDAALDNVAAGTLLTVTVAGNNILDNNKVGVNAAVSAAVAVLGGAASGAAAKLTP